MLQLLFVILTLTRITHLMFLGLIENISVEVGTEPDKIPYNGCDEEFYVNN